MRPPVALVLFTLGIAGLFYLDSDRSERVSGAVWLSAIWIWINGSRPISSWLDMAPQVEGGGQLPNTSFIDQLVAAVLMIAAFAVLQRRWGKVSSYLRASWPITLYFGFALLSLLWSDFPGWGFKRWFRALGDVAMALLIVTDKNPKAAIGRLFSRIGFILLPLSVLLIKYFPALGAGSTEWGQRMNVGVTTNKNSLGVITYVVGLGIAWNFLRYLYDKGLKHRIQRMVAQGVTLVFAVQVLLAAHCATAGACFSLGSGLMVITHLPRIKRNKAAIHGLMLTLLIGGGLILLLGGEADATHALGRNADLTGRTLVWDVVLPMVPSSLVGAGFETFWVGPRVEAIRSVLGFVNEAHNGYIETYLNLGWAGIILVALILLYGYMRSVDTFRSNPELGALLLTYVVTAAFYSISEVGFRMLNPLWFFLLLSVLAASRPIKAEEFRRGKSPRLFPREAPQEQDLVLK